MTVQTFNMKLRVTRELFYNEDSTFGIYAMEPLENNAELALNSYGNLSLQGTTRQLTEGNEYNVKFQGTFNHARYGEFYKISEVEADKLDTVTDQDNFLKAILTLNQFESLKKAYPNEKLVDLITDGKVDVKKTKGIKENTLKSITEKVVKNASISVLIAKLNELSLSTNAIARIMSHYLSADKAIQAIESNIYNLCDVDMYGFLTVDKIAMERGDNPTNNKRIMACVNYLLKKDNSSGHTWTSTEDLKSEMVELLGISAHFIDDVIGSLKTNKDYYIEDDKISFSHTHRQEVRVYSHLKRIQKHFVPPMVDREVADRKIKTIEEKQGFEFTEEQKNVIVNGTEHGVMVINGKGGTGKTGTVSGLMKFLDDPMYITCALSGVAVKVLDLRGVSASTIHRLLKYKPDVGFTHNEEEPLPHDVVVVDEISMVSVPLFLSVVRAVKNGAKLIVSGDSGQLSGIGVGNIIRDLLETNAFPSYELTQVHRQAAKSGILSVANTIREGQQVLAYGSSGREVFGELQDMTTISYNDKEQIPLDIIKISNMYKDRVKSVEDLMDFQVIVPNRERGALSVRNINLELQKIFNPSTSEGLKRSGYEYKVNDKIMAQGNSYMMTVVEDLDDYEALREELRMKQYAEDMGEEFDDSEFPKRPTTDVFNGTSGYIKHIVNKTALIKFDSVDGLVPFNQSDLDKITMAYAITVHRSQGNSFKNVLFALDYGAYTLLSRQLVYVALTRASKSCVMLCENGALYQAINNDESGNRRTFLRDIVRKDLSGEEVIKPASVTTN